MYQRLWCVIMIMTVLWLLAGCKGSSKGNSVREGDIAIAEIGDSVLYGSDVTRRIPQGLNPEDSLAMYKSIVNSWIETNLLLEYAEANLTNLEEIEVLVNRFRTQLLVTEYKRQMKLENVELSEDSVKAWYETHKKDYILESPLIKGIFVKVSSHNALKDRIIKLMVSDNAEDIEKLESELLEDMGYYSYFKDEWTDWDAVSSLIPHNFENANDFLKGDNLFTTTYNGTDYILYVSEYISSGKPMPFEYASLIIREYLAEHTSQREERQIISSLYAKAIKDGKLKINTEIP